MFFLGTLARWWRDRRRQIFHYHDSFQWRRADPVVVGSRLEEVCPDYQKLLLTLVEDAAKTPPGPIRDSMLDQQRAAGKELARVAMEVFGLLPLSEKGRGGVTRAEAIGVVTKYILFMEELARAAAPFATSPGAESQSRPASTTEPFAGSGTGGN